MWSCCPSMARPVVGPNADSDTGAPASPKAAAEAIKMTISGTE